MRRWIVLLPALALLPAGVHAESSPASALPTAPALRLGVLIGGDPLPDAVLAAAHRETERVLPLPNLEFHWRAMATHDARETFDRLIVVHLNGTCSIWASRQAPARRGALGHAHVSDGQILPFVEADCARLLRAATRLRLFPFRHCQESLGRALGRVLAHEMYHVLSESHEHDQQGLSKSSLTPADLYMPGAAFVPAALERIADRLFAPAR
jgi:hypothetical protein